MNLPDYLEPLSGGVYAIDTAFHREHFDAAYLVVQDGRAAFIDCGTNHAVPRLLGALQALGLAPDAVDLVIPTHVHLDHAGGAGLLMQHLPGATLWIHPRGLRHLLDPSALVQGATAVYGPEAMAREYGEIVPVAAERARSTHDGQVLHLAGRPLVVADTPGHARHHHALWDEATRGWFTGDTFGLSYRELDTAQGAWLLPTSTPVQFEPEVLAETVRRLLAADPQCMYLTHYGRVTDVQRLGALFLDLLQQMRALGLAQRGVAQTAAERHEVLRQGMARICHASLAAHGCTLPAAEIDRVLALDIELNAQGMGVWLDRLDRTPAPDKTAAA
jgi:glyoxylase-like metal-dependent hydrolase (beta-lactamase superfamily II)